MFCSLSNTGYQLHLYMARHLWKVLILYFPCCPSSGSGMYFSIVHPLNDISTHFMTDIWSWLDLRLLTIKLCFTCSAYKMLSCCSYAWRVMIVCLKHKRQCVLWGWCWMTWIWLVSKIECLSMGMDGREQRSLGKLQHCWEAWYVLFTVTKHWGGYCSFGALFLKFLFQHKRMKFCAK